MTWQVLCTNMAARRSWVDGQRFDTKEEADVRSELLINQDPDCDEAWPIETTKESDG